MIIGFILAGIVSGIISGMGIGGGTVLIPALTMFWGIEQKVAQSTNLIYFIPTAIIALISHIKAKNIEKSILITITLGGLIGAVVGSLLALRINPSLLKKCFGGFLLVMGLIEITKKADSNK